MSDQQVWTPALPLEILYAIAEQGDELTYRALLAVPVFARSLTASRRLHHARLYGHSVVHDETTGVRWLRHGRLHRLDGPAVQRADGGIEWWVDGKRHRTDGPAVDDAHFTVEYYRHDKLHRLDGPARVLSGAYRFWYVDGRPHRADGPAYEDDWGNASWWVHGRLHRNEGPAVINTHTGVSEWWLHGCLQFSVVTMDTET